MRVISDRAAKVLLCAVIAIALAFASGSAALAGAGAENAGVYIFAGGLCMAALIAAACCVYLKAQNKIIEEASQKITEYIAGDNDARINCDEEGELYKLFHKINSLASVLNAHAENELNSREFLKNTISDISHQLKTPLAALSIYNGIMQEGADNIDDVREFARLSEYELERIERLVQNLLKLAKLDAGTMVINRAPENIYEMFESVKKHFSFRADMEEKKINLSGDRELDLSCDRVWLSEALDNIVKNALDHTERGGCIDIEWEKLVSVIRIVIKDNGSGIHSQDIYHIFKRFYRSRFSKDTQGIGLGLPLAKAVIEAHNGSIEVNSEIGEGAEFIINFLIPTKL